MSDRPGWPPGRRPNSPGGKEQGEQGGSLPPWGTLGLGPDPGPGYQRDWNPPADELETERPLPDRPQSRVGRGARLIVPLLIGVLLLGVAGALVWFDVIGGSDGPTPTPTSSAVSLVPGGSTGTPVTGVPTAVGVGTTQVAVSSATTSAVESPTATIAPTQVVAATPATTLLLAAGGFDAAGLKAQDVVTNIREALAQQLAGRTIEIVTGDRLNDATIVVGSAETVPDFATRTVAISPLALVTSPRLALTGVGRAQAEQLLKGGIVDWRNVGAAPSLTVEPLAIQGSVLDGANPIATYDDYNALVAGLQAHPGGVALVPVGEVDLRVNVLAVDGVDPLRQTGDVMRYAFGSRFSIAVRADQAAALQPAIDAALTTMSLPRPLPAVARVAFAGDVVPVANEHQQFGAGDATHTFAEVASMLSEYDLTIVTLNGALTNAAATPAAATATPIVTSPDLAQGLASAGVDAVSLANDRSMAAGATALTETIALLQTAGLNGFGAGADLTAARAPLILAANGVKIALLGFDGVTANADRSLPGTSDTDFGATNDTPGTNPLESSRVRASIRSAAQRADLVLVVIAMGVAGQETTPAWAIDVAHAAIDAGASAVIANHSGMVGGTEIYQGKPIVYSLGNLVSDQMQSVQTRQGMIAELTIRDGAIVGIRFHGIEITDFNQPRPMTGDEEAALLDRIWLLSDRLGR